MSPHFTEINENSLSAKRFQVFGQNNSKTSLAPFNHNSKNLLQQAQQKNKPKKVKKAQKKDFLKNIDSLEKALWQQNIDSGEVAEESQGSINTPISIERLKGGIASVNGVVSLQNSGLSREHAAVSQFSRILQVPKINVLNIDENTILTPHIGSSSAITKSRANAGQ